MEAVELGEAQRYQKRGSGSKLWNLHRYQGTAGDPVGDSLSPWLDGVIGVLQGVNRGAEEDDPVGRSSE